MKNLWSEDLLKSKNVVLPITILQQQAKYLNEMTKNIVIANINTKRIILGTKLDETKPGIVHILKIVAPAMGNYDFELLKIFQEQMLPYPLRVWAPLTEDSYDVNDPDGLEDALTLVFNNEKTIEAIQSLILQSKNMDY